MWRLDPRLGFLLKALVTYALLVFAFRRAGSAEGFGLSLEPGWLPLLVLAMAAQVMVVCERWGLVLRAFGLDGGWLQDGRIHLIGQWLDQARLAHFTGDLGRLAMLRRRGGGRGDAARAVLLDRAVALATGLAATALLLPLLIAGLLRQDASAHLPLVWLVAAVLIALALTLGLALLGRLRLPFGPPTDLFAALRRAPELALGPAAMSLFGHGLTLVVAWTLAKSLGLAIDFLPLLLALPPVLLLAALPVSLAGWGPREIGLVLLLGAFAVSPAEALALSIGLGLLQLAQGGLGALLWRRERARGALLGLYGPGLAEALRRFAVATWTSESRRRWLLLAAATAVASLAAIAWIDRPVALYLHEERPQWLRDIFGVFSGLGRGEAYYVGGAIVLIAGLLVPRFAAAEATRAYCRRLAGSAAFFVSALAIVGLSLLAFKQLFGRLRPKYLWQEDMLHGFFPFNGDMGALAFPSGHTTTAFTVAAALFILFGRFRWPLVFVAAMVGMARVVLAKHYVGDVIAGAFLGWAGTYLLYHWWCLRWSDPAVPPLPDTIRSLWRRGPQQSPQGSTG